MEEDIKILEEFVEDYEHDGLLIQYRVMKAIEHLIARNKELEDKCIGLSTTINALKVDNKEFVERNKKQEKLISEYNKRGQTISNLMNAKDTLMYKEICKNFIPKSKVLELIKQLEIIQKEEPDAYLVILYLQKLLEGDKYDQSRKII